MKKDIRELVLLYLMKAIATDYKSTMIGYIEEAIKVIKKDIENNS